MIWKEDWPNITLVPIPNIVLQQKYKCYYLVWFERHQYINHAIEREKEIKGWLRSKKIKLIEEENPKWRFLNNDLMEWPPKSIQ